MISVKDSIYIDDYVTNKLLISFLHASGPIAFIEPVQGQKENVYNLLKGKIIS